MADQMRYDTLTPQLTPALFSLSQTGLTMSRAYTSTPSCTPSRSAILTGLSPWYHGMLGYGDIPPKWPFEMPSAMSALGYHTACVGKNHYYNPVVMPNSSSPPPSHGWHEEFLYDGLGDGMDAGETDGGEFDNYDAWFANVTGGKDPLATGKPLINWNSWRGAPYAYDEALHPTAWVGRTACKWLDDYARAGGPSAATPFFLKVSFHRPHSPYDPPARLLNETLASELPPVRVSNTWDAKFADERWCSPFKPHFSYPFLPFLYPFLPFSYPFLPLSYPVLPFSYPFLPFSYPLLHPFAGAARRTLLRGAATCPKRSSHSHGAHTAPASAS